MVVETRLPPRDDLTPNDDLELTILMPCLNEESGIVACVREAKRAIYDAGVLGEVLVVDNGSTDRSIELARSAGARVVRESSKGYGNAYLRGFRDARGKYIIMGDSDGTYDFSMAPEFMARLREGDEFVNGSRTKGKIEPGAMPLLHRYFGVPLLSWMLRRLSGLKLSDAHCGIRGFTREAVKKMDLRTPGMEFASEMILQAARAKLRTSELPVPYRSRHGESKLRTFSDGWRHLRFMLLYSPKQLFFTPGVASLSIGLVLMLALVWGKVQLAGVTFDIHYMVVGSLLSLLGFEVLALGLCGGMYANSIGILRDDSLIRWGQKHLTLEKGLMLGLVITSAGLGVFGWILFTWMTVGFGTQPIDAFLRPALLALTMVLLGAQTFFGAFLLSLLTLQRDNSTNRTRPDTKEPVMQSEPMS